MCVCRCSVYVRVGVACVCVWMGCKTHRARLDRQVLPTAQAAAATRGAEATARPRRANDAALRCGRDRIGRMGLGRMGASSQLGRGAAERQGRHWGRGRPSPPDSPSARSLEPCILLEPLQACCASCRGEGHDAHPCILRVYARLEARGSAPLGPPECAPRARFWGSLQGDWLRPPECVPKARLWGSEGNPPEDLGGSAP